MKIGIFDSGMGGLFILKNIKKRLPKYDYVYYGDNARVPYGNRSTQIIYQFTQEAVDFLFKKNCQLIILACNTASSNALRKIQQDYLPKNYPDKKVLGVIRPTVEFLENYKNKKIKVGIIGTSATINSQAFSKEIKKISHKIKVFEKACPLLVPYIESFHNNKKILELILSDYLKLLIKNKIEILILGCTHYGLIKKEIKKVVGSRIKVIDQGDLIAERLEIYLKNHPEIEKKLSKNQSIEFYFSDYNENYQKLKELFFNE